MEDLEKAVEDTIIALNTGVLRSRNGDILKTHRGKSSIENSTWRTKLNVISDMLVSIKQRLFIAREDKIYWSNRHGNYCFNDREISEWFDLTRAEIIKILSSICSDAKIDSQLEFPRKRFRNW